MNVKKTTSPSKRTIDVNSNEGIICILLCLLLGELGIHRFYSGKIGTGILYLFTLGILGIGVLVDLILIVFGKWTIIKRK